MELKGRRELFCREYIARNLHGTNAATAAGYSAERAATTASELLAEPEIQNRIAALAAGRNKKLEIDAGEVLLELLRMLRADPLNYVDEVGCVKSLHEIPLDARRAIASFEVEEMPTLGATKTKVKFWNKEKAAELIGRHLSIFNDKLKLEGGDVAALISAARDRSSSLV